MPKINLLTSINTATSSTFVVVSDNGFARRVSFNNFSNSVASTFVLGNARTDQNLYTTSSINFHRVDLIGATTATGYANSLIGFSTQYSHLDGTAIKNNDIIGALRFGGYDGNILREDSFQLSASASEDWQNISLSTTTNFGSSWELSFQAAGIRLTTSSSMTMLYGYTDTLPTSLSPPILGLSIGSAANGATPTLIKSDGSATYTGHGRTELGFVHTSIQQAGVTGTDPSPDNPTLLNTNRYTFQTSRKSAVPERRLPLLSNDIIGRFDFRGTDNASSHSDGLGASIYVHAIENFTTSTHGTAITLQTTNSGSSDDPVRRAYLSSNSNIYTSNRHTFEDSILPATNMMDISTTGTTFFNGLWKFSSTSTGGVTFPDGSVQSTAFSVLTFPPLTSNSTGTVGQIAHDAGYVYMCVGTNLWKRFAATTF